MITKTHTHWQGHLCETTPAPTLDFRFMDSIVLNGKAIGHPYFEVTAVHPHNPSVWGIATFTEPDGMASAINRAIDMYVGNIVRGLEQETLR